MRNKRTQKHIKRIFLYNNIYKEMETINKSKMYYEANKEKYKLKYQEKKKEKIEEETNKKIGRPRVNNDINLTSYTKLVRMKNKLDQFNLSCEDLDKRIQEYDEELTRRHVKH